MFQRLKAVNMMLSEKYVRLYSTQYNAECIQKSASLLCSYCQPRMLFNFRNTCDWSPFVRWFLCSAEYGPATAHIYITVHYHHNCVSSY